MATSLIQGASSAYINAQNALRSKRALPEVYVYVEGRDDVEFWKECLRPFSSNRRFKVTHLRKTDDSIVEGKSHLIACIGTECLGPNKYVAVDADYDWIIDNYRPSLTSESISYIIRNNPYIFHTFLYSIENYKCHPFCIAAMMDKIAGTSDKQEILKYFTSLSTALANLFLIHLVSTDKCDGVYCLKEFRRDMAALSVDISSMELDEKSLIYISQRESSLKDYSRKYTEEVQYYREKLKTAGFDESRYYLLMQGHIIENIVVKKHIPNKILKLRKETVDGICSFGDEEQMCKRLKQFEERTGITVNNRSNYPKSTKALLKDINSLLGQLIYDCTDFSKAEEGYTHLIRTLEKAFGKPSY